MIDLVKLCRRYGIAYAEGGAHHHVTTGWIGLNCPFCAADSGFHLGYSLERGTFNCWRCGPVGFWKAIRAILKTEDRSRLDSIVAEFGGAERPAPAAPLQRPAEPPTPPGMGRLSAAHVRYLQRRDFSPAALRATWDLRGTGAASGAWSWRVIAPVRNAARATVAYQGRSIIDSRRGKYKMTDTEECAEDPATMLYGIEEATGPSVIVVEGITGVWRFGPGAVATFGINWKPEQANKLRQYKRRFILFDPERAAQIKARELGELLSVFDGDTEVLSGFRDDPGDMTNAQAKRIRRMLNV